jgi:hypothetical protein
MSMSGDGGNIENIQSFLGLCNTANEAPADITIKKSRDLAEKLRSAVQSAFGKEGTEEGKQLKKLVSELDSPRRVVIYNSNGSFSEKFSHYISTIFRLFLTKYIDIADFSHGIEAITTELKQPTEPISEDARKLLVEKEAKEALQKDLNEARKQSREKDAQIASLTATAEEKSQTIAGLQVQLEPQSSSPVPLTSAASDSKKPEQIIAELRQQAENLTAEKAQASKENATLLINLTEKTATARTSSYSLAQELKSALKKGLTSALFGTYFHEGSPPESEKTSFVFEEKKDNDGITTVRIQDKDGNFTPWNWESLPIAETVSLAKGKGNVYWILPDSSPMTPTN